jgi:hypothetical protein
VIVDLFHKFPLSLYNTAIVIYRLWLMILNLFLQNITLENLS